MSADARTIPPPPPPPLGGRPSDPPSIRNPDRDVKVRDTLPRETEKEKIKRQLYNLIDRVDKL